MTFLENKVAVITGAASGIGLGLATYCAQEKMHLVLADIDEAALADAEKAFRHLGVTVLAVQTDVSKSEAVNHLAAQTLERFGHVDMLFNNAGILPSLANIWETSENDWRRAIDVNLLGVVNGLRTFVPLMLRQDTECHIINVASVAGLITYYFSAAYQVTKHAVVALTEQLYFSLHLQRSKIKASVLCPGYVKTNILDNMISRNAEGTHPHAAAMLHQFQQTIENGMPVAELAKHTFDALKENRFYILPHAGIDGTDAVINKRCEDILHRQNPDVFGTMALFGKR